MKTYPYQDGDRLIQLVEKRELDQLVERLAEARESHLHASARDVQTIQRQSILLERLAGALASITEEYEDRKFQFGDDYLWVKHENVDALPNAFSALAAYESTNPEPVARLIAAAPDLLEALELYALSYSDEELVHLAECTSGMGEISPVTAKREIIRRVAIAKAKGEQP
jgi:hypothetical protein